MRKKLSVIVLILMLGLSGRLLMGSGAKSEVLQLEYLVSHGNVTVFLINKSHTSLLLRVDTEGFRYSIHYTGNSGSKGRLSSPLEIPSYPTFILLEPASSDGDVTMKNAYVKTLDINKKSVASIKELVVSSMYYPLDKSAGGDFEKNLIHCLLIGSEMEVKGN